MDWIVMLGFGFFIGIIVGRHSTRLWPTIWEKSRIDYLKMFLKRGIYILQMLVESEEHHIEQEALAKKVVIEVKSYTWTALVDMAEDFVATHHSIWGKDDEDCVTRTNVFESDE